MSFARCTFSNGLATPCATLHQGNLVLRVLLSFAAILVLRVCFIMLFVWWWVIDVCWELALAQQAQTTVAVPSAGRKIACLAHVFFGCVVVDRLVAETLHPTRRYAPP